MMLLLLACFTLQVHSVTYKESLGSWNAAAWLPKKVEYTAGAWAKHGTDRPVVGKQGKCAGVTTPGGWSNPEKMTWYSFDDCKRLCEKFIPKGSNGLKQGCPRSMTYNYDAPPHTNMHCSCHPELATASLSQTKLAAWGSSGSYFADDWSCYTLRNDDCVIDVPPPKKYVGADGCYLSAAGSRYRTDPCWWISTADAPYQGSDIEGCLDFCYNTLEGCDGVTIVDGSSCSYFNCHGRKNRDYLKSTAKVDSYVCPIAPPPCVDQDAEAATWYHENGLTEVNGCSDVEYMCRTHAPTQNWCRFTCGRCDSVANEQAVGGCQPTTMYEYWSDYGKGEKYCGESLATIRRLNIVALKDLYNENTNQYFDRHTGFEDVGTVKVSIASGYLCGSGGAAIYKIELCLDSRFKQSDIDSQLSQRVDCDNNVGAWESIYDETLYKYPTNLDCYAEMWDEDDVAAAGESLAFAETAPSWTATVTNVLAAFGMAVTAYGAFKHYVGK